MKYGVARDVAVLAQIVPYIEAEFDAQEKKIIARILKLYDDDKLGPHEALEGWIQIAALRKIMRSMQVRQRTAVGEASVIAPELTIG